MRLRVGRYRRIPVQTNVSPMFVLVMVVSIFAFVGGIFAVLGVVFSRADAKIKEVCSVSVQAEVTDLMSNGEGLVTPVYRYEYNGTTHSSNNHGYSNKPIYNIGDTAKIRINPDDPQQIYVPKDSMMESMSLIFRIVGFSLLGVSVLVGILVGWGLRSAATEKKHKEEPWEM